ncbi:phage head closure protein [Caballeronia sp. S22]|uniref:phage head closure protein n=1 Tax=Caballeronia sp. S22 TaxID=3137182 RepID=UPI0035311E23
MATDINEFDKRVTVRRWLDVPDSGFGIEQTFDDGMRIWAKVEPVSSGIFFGSKQLEQSVTHRFTVRRSSQVTESSVTAEHVVEYRGERYRVKRTIALEGRRDRVAIDAELLGAI